jgi:tRNA threonylcarbamoyladenosine biosynthesis protein TsaB
MKKILALETTEKFGSAALLDGKNVLAEIDLPKDRRSSQTLHLAVQTLFLQSQIDPHDIGTVAVVIGPGSFTGLRIGVTAAKLFAYAAGAKIAALDTFQVVAAGTEYCHETISVGVDAQRGEVIAALFQRTESGQIKTIRKPELLSVADWQKHAEQYENVLFTGPALERWHHVFHAPFIAAEERHWFPKASVAGKLAADRIQSGQFDDHWSLLPIYSRLSAAEEKR